MLFRGKNSEQQTVYKGRLYTVKILCNRSKSDHLIFKEQQNAVWKVQAVVESNQVFSIYSSTLLKYIFKCKFYAVLHINFAINQRQI